MGSPHTYNARLLEANAAVIPDPLAGGTIQVGGNFKTCVTLTSTGAEARSLAPPNILGQEIEVSNSLLGGTITVTLITAAGSRTTGYNNGTLSAWNTHTITLVGGGFKAVAISSTSGVLRWMLVANCGGVAA